MLGQIITLVFSLVGVKYGLRRYVSANGTSYGFVMVHFICQFEWAMVYQDILLIIIQYF